MRFKLATFFAACSVVIVIAYLYWPPSAETPEELVLPTQAFDGVRQTNSNLNSKPPLNISNPRFESFINGIVIDNNDIALVEAELLHRLLSVSPDRDCFGLEDIQFELNETTELIISDQRGLFALPFDWFVPEDDQSLNQKYCLIVSASKSGFISSTVSLPITSDAIPDRIEIELTPSLLLEGTVIDPQNDLLNKAQISVWKPADRSTKAELNCADPPNTIESSVISNPRGQFQIDLANDSSYCIQASHPNWARSRSVFLAKNNMPEELRLQLLARQRLLGKTVALDGTPLSNIALELAPANGQKISDNSAEKLSTVSNAVGDFAFNSVDTIEYTLTSKHEYYRVAKPKALSANSNQDPVTVSLFSVSTITGQVYDNRGNPLADVAINARSPFSVEHTTVTTHSDNDGYFELKSLHQSGVAQENFKMAMAFVEYSTGPQQFNGQVCIDFYHPQFGSESIDLSSGERSVDLGDIRLPLAAIELVGTVVNHRNQPLVATLSFTLQPSQPKKSLQARLPQCGDIDLVRTTSSDENGNFNLMLSEEGLYQIKVETDLYSDRLFEQEFRQSINSLELKLN